MNATNPRFQSCRLVEERVVEEAWEGVAVDKVDEGEEGEREEQREEEENESEVGDEACVWEEHEGKMEVEQGKEERE